MNTSNSTCIKYEESFLNVLSESQEVYDTMSELVIAILVIACSVPFVLFGAKIFKLVACIATAIFVFYFTLSNLQGTTGFSCTSRLSTSGVLSLITTLLVLSMIKVALFVLGAVAFGTFAHFSIISLPVNHTTLPNIGRNSVLYYAIVLCSAIVGGIAVRCKETCFLQLSTSCIGGFGILYGVHALTTLHDIDISNVALLGCGIFISMFGFVFQRRCTARTQQSDS